MAEMHQELKKDRRYEELLAAVNHRVVTVTATTGECRIARMTCARSPIRACARAGCQAGECLDVHAGLKAAWPAPVKTIACTPEARSTTAS